MKAENERQVVIFGRTNVGKSTLFNCLIEKKQALVSKIAGTTRDSNIGQVSWRGKNFTIVDTGGIMDIGLLSETRKKRKESTTDIDITVQRQARDYLRSADLVLFLVDVQDGLLSTDKAMSQSLKKIVTDKNKIVLVANKADSLRLRNEVAEFNKLGLGEPITVSSVTGSGTGDLLDIVYEKLENSSSHKIVKESELENPEDDVIKITIIGKPNVGKSSLLNAIAGEERVIVSPIPHTTREPQDTVVTYRGRTIKLLDTAGISRQGQKDVRSAKLRQSLERQSIVYSLNTLRKADIIFLVIDIKAGLTHQEAKLVEVIVEKKVSLIIVANKWDLISEPDRKKYTDIIYGKLPFVTWAPIQFVSAKSGKKVNKILDQAIEIYDQRKTVIGQNGLDKFLGSIVKKQRPVKRGGQKQPYIYELKQVSAKPPVFSIRIGSKDNIAFSYLKYIENRLREKFGFFGSPVTVYVERNKRIHGKHEKQA